MSREAKKGAGFERMVADYMAADLEQPIDRRVKCGSRDRGDISGLKVCGCDCVVECKNKKRMELSQWVEEAEAERVNAKATFGIVVHKRRGCGKANAGGNYVTMTLDTFIDIVREADKW